MGGAHPLSNGRTIARLPTGRDTWQVTKKRNEEVLETSVVSLGEFHGPPSGNGIPRSVKRHPTAGTRG
jgi:hypothetical protein